MNLSTTTGSPAHTPLNALARLEVAPALHPPLKENRKFASRLSQMRSRNLSALQNGGERRSLRAGSRLRKQLAICSSDRELQHSFLAISDLVKMTGSSSASPAVVERAPLLSHTSVVPTEEEDNLVHAEPGTVFVVDDEEMVGMVVQDLLELQGFKSRLFLSPTEALEAFQTADTKPVLLLTDYVMDPINGLELIASCRQIVPNLPTILYTGMLEATVFRNATIRPTQFLSKPFLAATLLHTVRLALGN